MKTIDISAQPEVAAIVKSAQKQQLLLTKNGKPAAVLLGLNNYDAEDFGLASSPAFWEMIESRRRGPSVPLADLKSRLKLTSRRKSSASTSRRRTTTSHSKARS